MGFEGYNGAVTEAVTRQRFEKISLTNLPSSERMAVSYKKGASVRQEPPVIEPL